MTNNRRIVRRVVGERHGPITRLISPSELGEDLKPFIFLDFFDANIEPGFGFGMHPHSGIATLTWQPAVRRRNDEFRGQFLHRHRRRGALRSRLIFSIESTGFDLRKIGDPNRNYGRVTPAA